MIEVKNLTKYYGKGECKFSDRIGKTGKTVKSR